MSEEDIYTDDNGKRYYAVARMPYRELLPGCRFALQGERRVYVWGRPGPQGRGERWLEEVICNLRKSMVLVLRRLKEDNR